MADDPQKKGTIEEERGITPVSGDSAGPNRAVLQRGVGATALMAFAAIFLWGSWSDNEAKEVPERERVVIRQASTFVPAPQPEPPPPETQPISMEPLTPPPVLQAPPTDELLESARRAPVMAYDRPVRTEEANSEDLPYPSADVVYPDLSDIGQPRNELADKLQPTPLEGVSAARLPNRHLVVTQGTSIPCVLETAMSSDVPGFVSCVMIRDVMSDSGHVVLMDKGTQVVGEYQGGVRRGSSRMFVLWNRAKTPNGVIVNLASPATDVLGRSGVSGKIDTHFRERFGAALLLSIVDDAGAYAGQRLADGGIQMEKTAGSGADAAAIAVERSIDIPPTLNKHQGELVNIFVARDLDFSTVYDLKLTEDRSQIYDRTVSGDYSKPGVVYKQ